jgi:geranylgeranylglycerol-phosphate geranylgeranyltransferase
MGKLKAYMQLFRPELPFSAGICVVLGQIFGLETLPPPLMMASGFGAVFFISASILILNDYFDIEIDRINAPERPLPSNRVSSIEVFLLSIMVAGLGLIISFRISIAAFFISIALLIIGFFYNWKLKKTGFIGNMMVSLSVGMTFIFGGVSVHVPFHGLVWFFGIFTALIDLGEEIAADAMDMKGDSRIQSGSIALKYGRRKALNISALIFSTDIMLSIVPFLFDWLTGIYLVPILIMDGAIIYFAAKLRISDETEGRKYIRLIYLSGLLGMLIILFMKIL